VEWDNISMDYVMALPKTQKMDFVTALPNTRRNFDSIWVIVDSLTKSAHFIPVQNQFVILHGVPSSIV